MGVEASQKITSPSPAPAKLPRFPWFWLLVLIVMALGLMVQGFVGLALAVAALLVVSVLSGVFLLAPYRFKQTFWMSSKPEIRAIDADTPGTPPDFASGVRAMAETLGPLGFVERGLFFVEKVNSAASLYIAIFENRSERTFARWVKVVSAKATEPILIFATRFSDGSEVLTSNNQAPTPAPLPKHRKGFGFPGIQGPARLFGLHRRAIAELGEFSARVDRGQVDVIGYVRDLVAEETAHMAEVGYCQIDPSSGLHRLTWKGAYLSAWKLLWPWKPIHRSHRRLVAARRLRSWEGATV